MPWNGGQGPTVKTDFLSKIKGWFHEAILKPIESKINELVSSDRVASQLYFDVWFMGLT